MRDPEVGARHPIGTLVVVLGANVAFGAGLFFHAFLYNFYLEGLGFGEGAMGLAQALLTVGGLAVLLPAGTLVDRWGAGRVAAAGTLAATAGLVATALASGPAAIYVASVLSGAGIVAWRVATGPLLLALAPEHARSRVFSWNVGLLVASGGLWIALAGDLPARLGAGLPGLRLTLLIGAGLSGLGALVFLALARRASVAVIVNRDTDLASRQTSWRPSRYAALAALVAAWMLAPALIAPFLNLFFVREAGWALGTTGLLFAAGHVVTAVVVIGGGEVAQRRGPLAALVGWVALFAPVVWLLALVRAAPALAGLYVLQGLASPATNALIDQLLLEGAPADRRGTVSAWRNAATEASGAGGAAVGGWMLERLGFAALFSTAGVVGLVGGLSLAGAVRRLRAAVEPRPAGQEE